MLENYQIQKAHLGNVHFFFDWASQEQWNPGIGDPHTFHKAYPDGFYFGMINERPIASISAPIYHSHYAFIGYYIVSEERFRHQGLGLYLWNHSNSRKLDSDWHIFS